MSCSLAERSIAKMNSMSGNDRNISNAFGDTASTDDDENDHSLWQATFSNHRIASVSRSSLRLSDPTMIIQHPESTEGHITTEHQLQGHNPISIPVQSQRQQNKYESEEDKKLPAFPQQIRGPASDNENLSLERTPPAYQSPLVEGGFDSARHGLPLDDPALQCDDGFLSQNDSILSDQFDEEYAPPGEYEFPYQHHLAHHQHPGSADYRHSMGAAHQLNAMPIYPQHPLRSPGGVPMPTYPPPPQGSPHFAQPHGHYNPAPLPLAFRFGFGGTSYLPAMPNSLIDHERREDSKFYSPHLSPHGTNRRITRSSSQKSYLKQYHGPGFGSPQSPTAPMITTMEHGYSASAMTDSVSRSIASLPGSRSSQIGLGRRRALVPSDEELDTAPNKRARDALYTWYERLSELYDYKDIHGDCNVPQQYPPNRRLGIWVNKQRMEKKAWDSRSMPDQLSTSLTKRKLLELGKAGFTWAKPKGEQSWYEKYHELLDYVKANKHCNVPTKYAPNPALGRWVSTQRSQYKEFIRGHPTKITQERIDKLNNLQFTWDMVAKVEEDEERDLLRNTVEYHL